MLGRLIEEHKEVNTPQLTIPINNWRKGLYTVRIQVQNGVFVKKVVVQ
ncbi:MAG: T9SS type A sorting domain-containing protein [Bacteroidales bacterium]|nr:T9SS type A sorting domain-containing protein [Bacteroidales bacterium]